MSSLLLLLLLFAPISQAKAATGLTISFSNSPLFSSAAMAPGDTVNRTFTVTNNDPVARMVAVKATNINRLGGLPSLDSTLMITIRDGSTVLYGPALLSNIMVNSPSIVLGPINVGQTKTYSVEVVFPSSAGNEYQNKGITFDFSVGKELSNQLVINEIYPAVDSQHGLDCASSQIGSGVSTVNNSVNINASTGGNNSNNNTGNGSVRSGPITILINIITNIFGGSRVGNCDEWIELFNPTPSDIPLKGWKLTDNSGIVRTINANRILKAGHFALVAQSTRTFSRFWQVPFGTVVTDVDHPIGDGLAADGDHLILTSPVGTPTDSIAWGSDPLVPHFTGTIGLGQSLARLVPGFDTDSGTDFNLSSPSPGQ